MRLRLGLIVQIAGVVLLGGVWIVGEIHDQRLRDQENRDFTEHIQRMDEMHHRSRP